ncbi:MAG: DUF3015 domain-containing protein [Nitrospira sp.]|nr:DUF3015 domain-containing protein [Nitrospira sp.]MDH4371318.1 DUF3015 domain-containing protein [Nitrospira sp.]MDH5348624.1 DUF3015 domain-containing protein [Nitrospira sp.]MDH5498920.1 DUF3015 domain-containing protein [Nitrospira sp.]MDH5725951.1 DUF3015 domain-containing protein [Nitrospira sp.]
MRNILGCILISSASLLLGATGCTIKGTINQITDTTSNVTGTTSGQAWWNEDGQIKPDFKATAFVTLNQESLRQDLAAGRGEYLASVSTLLGVPEDRQSAFFSAVQAGYTGTAGTDSPALLALLQDTSRAFVR